MIAENVAAQKRFRFLVGFNAAAIDIFWPPLAQPGLNCCSADARKPPVHFALEGRPPGILSAIAYGQCVCRYCASAIRIADATGVMLMPVCACTAWMNAPYIFAASRH